jgi:hypothetical protein
MNLVNAILLSLAAGFIIIGIYETMVAGFGKAYWAIMVSVVLFFVYTYRKKR